MTTKQQRKTAARKAKQTARRARDKLVLKAMECVSGPSTTKLAEKMSNQQLERIISLHKHYPSREPVTIDDMEMFGAVEMEAVVEDLHRNGNDPYRM